MENIITIWQLNRGGKSCSEIFIFLYCEEKQFVRSWVLLSNLPKKVVDNFQGKWFAALVTRW